jgi:hypothetical protein
MDQHGDGADLLLCRSFTPFCPSACDHRAVRPRVIGVVLAALLMGVVVLLVVSPQMVWSLDGQSLETSIEDEFGYEIDNCVHLGVDAWRCDYARDALSGIAGRVLVRQRGGRCWSASTERSTNAPSESKEGCVSAWQFFRAT